MAGTRKESGPKHQRQRAEAPSPTRAVMCLLSFIHCSRKITTNMAVMTKSSPWVSKVRTEPSSPPRAAPETQ